VVEGTIAEELAPTAGAETVVSSTAFPRRVGAGS
jgi:hypothetical protein